MTHGTRWPVYALIPLGFGLLMLQGASELIKRAAILGGRKPPRFTVPTRVLKLISPAGPVLAPVLGMPKNLKEAVAASDGVTYYASHAKATAELDYRPRSITDGLASALT